MRTARNAVAAIHVIDVHGNPARGTRAASRSTRPVRSSGTGDRRCPHKRPRGHRSPLRTSHDSNHLVVSSGWFLRGGVDWPAPHHRPRPVPAGSRRGTTLPTSRSTDARLSRLRRWSSRFPPQRRTSKSRTPNPSPHGRRASWLHATPNRVHQGTPRPWESQAPRNRVHPRQRLRGDGHHPVIRFSNGRSRHDEGLVVSLKEPSPHLPHRTGAARHRGRRSPRAVP